MTNNCQDFQFKFCFGDQDKIDWDKLKLKITYRTDLYQCKAERPFKVIP